jgi:uncharacterized DUF497 family protein
VEFRWNAWNIEHIAEHRVLPEEAERVVESARGPYPLARSDDKWLVIGRGYGGRWLQVVYIFSPEDRVFVIHARPLTDREKRRQRKRER